MKAIILLLQFIARIGTIISTLWAIVEFLLYLVKDKEFNWWSIWIMLICMGIHLIAMLAQLFIGIMNSYRADNVSSDKQGRMTFQQRLEAKARQ